MSEQHLLWGIVMFLALSRLIYLPLTSSCTSKHSPTSLRIKHLQAEKWRQRGLVMLLRPQYSLAAIKITRRTPRGRLRSLFFPFSSPFFSPPPFKTTIPALTRSSSSHNLASRLNISQAVMQEVRDDKAAHVVPFILERLALHQKRHDGETPAPPFIIGLNGVQGAGKTVLVSILQETLESPPHSLPTVVFSLDDLYLSHADQVALAASNPDNPLLQHRGQPSTHDIPLALSVFSSLKAHKPTAIPQYNKALFSGQGDRVPPSEWDVVNQPGHPPIQVIIFEGWSVGFRPLSPSQLSSIHSKAISQHETSPASYHGRLAHNTLPSLTTINEALKEYNALTDQFDAFVHIDAAEPLYVYKWRAQQEEGLWRSKGSGMTEEQVKAFVDGYFPSYELYTEGMRKGVFMKPVRGGGVDEGRQMRLVVGEDRKVRKVIRI